MFSANGIAVFCMAVFILCAVRCCAVALLLFLFSMLSMKRNQDVKEKNLFGINKSLKKYFYAGSSMHRHRRRSNRVACMPGTVNNIN